MANFKVTCPKSIKHTKFSVIAHVAQEWEVDENSNFMGLKNSCTDVLHSPDKDDHFICLTCGAEAFTLQN